MRHTHDDYCYTVLYAQEAFAKYVDVNSVAESLAAPKAARLTPKAFMHSITQKCQANPQHIVLPEVHITTLHFIFCSHWMILSLKHRRGRKPGPMISDMKCNVLLSVCTVCATRVL